MFDPNTKILVIDDMLTARKFLSRSLTGLGFKSITEAVDGQNGWDLLVAAQPPFQLILSDLSMPNLSGVELLRRLRGDERFKKVPFMLLTAESENHEIKEAFKAGVDNYMVKPISVEALRTKLVETHMRVAGR